MISVCLIKFYLPWNTLDNIAAANRPTFLSLGFSYGISESYSNKIFHKMRVILAEIVGLKNPDKLKFKDVKTVIIDVTVQPIERPIKQQELYYNGSKKTYN